MLSLSWLQKALHIFIDHIVMSLSLQRLLNQSINALHMRSCTHARTWRLRRSSLQRPNYLAKSWLVIALQSINQCSLCVPRHGGEGGAGPTGRRHRHQEAGSQLGEQQADLHPLPPGQPHRGRGHQEGQDIFKTHSFSFSHLLWFYVLSLIYNLTIIKLAIKRGQKLQLLSSF